MITLADVERELGDLVDHADWIEAEELRSLIRRIAVEVERQRLA